VKGNPSLNLLLNSILLASSCCRSDSGGHGCDKLLHRVVLYAIMHHARDAHGSFLWSIMSFDAAVITDIGRGSSIKRGEFFRSQCSSVCRNKGGVHEMQACCNCFRKCFISVALFFSFYLQSSDFRQLFSTVLIDGFSRLAH
jgi:hypothetical protein